MSNKRILIAFGSRYGSSKEISYKIGEILKQQGFEVEIFDLNKTRNNKFPSVELYDGVILGSGIRIGKWTKKAKQFLINNKTILEEKKIPIGIFVSSLLASEPTLYESSKQEFLLPTLKKIGFEPNLSDIFGGVYDLSETTQKKWYERMLVKRVLNQEKYKGTILPGFKDNIRNDYRDWNKIEAFANEFAKIIKDLSHSVNVRKII